MKRLPQLKALFRQEIKRNVRSKSILIIIFVLPLFLWGMQVGLLYLDIDQSDKIEDEVFYFINLDRGNQTINMGDLLKTTLLSQLDNPRSFLANLSLKVVEFDFNENDVKKNYDAIFDKVREENISPLVLVEHNFTTIYNSYDEAAPVYAMVDVLSLPTDINLANQIYREMRAITQSYPFLVASYDSLTYSTSRAFVPEGEDIVDKFDIFMLSFFALYGALLAPSGIVSSAFAVEREKKTLESILVLPITKFEIMMTKFLSGSVFMVIFAIVNIIGMLMYKFLRDLMLENNDMFNASFEFTVSDIFITFLTIFLVSITGYGLGIAITSGSKDVKTAVALYNFIIAMPFAIIAVAIMLGGFPDGLHPVYLIPWTHALSILFKGIFPNSDLTQMLTSSLSLDIVIHILILLLFIILSFFIASKLQDRVFKLES